MKTIGQIYKELDDNNQIENYAEYDIEQLMHAFTLERHDANTLYLALQGDTNVDYNIPTDSDAFMNMVDEAQHQSFDGWSDDEIVVIKAFLADISFAVKEEAKSA